MARMLPAMQPRNTGSKAEERVFALLRDGLSDDFTVIHSLPWLCAAVRRIRRDYAPTGEVDFVIVHPDMGVLALEIKGGGYRVESGQFVPNFQTDDGRLRDPVRQLRHNVHGLSAWLHRAESLSIRIGYAWVFPGSNFGDTVPSPAMVDFSNGRPERIVIDQSELPRLAARIQEVYQFWLSAEGCHPLGARRAHKIVHALCPFVDGVPPWLLRVHMDGIEWLGLTPEQSQVLERDGAQQRSLVTGWPGTGKTLLALELARRAAGNTLLVVFNNLLADHLRRSLAPKGARCRVVTWHQLCGEAGQHLERSIPSFQEVKDEELADVMTQAVSQGFLCGFDQLVIDEAQALHAGWGEALAIAFQGKPIHAFCDESQVFGFERDRVTLAGLETLIGTRAYHLSVVLRMPTVVSQRLRTARPPANVQPSFPRPIEPDALQELACNDPAQALRKLHDELKTQGVPSPDIVVLSRLSIDSLDPGFVATVQDLGLRHLTVARFRGLEAPVAFIVGCEDMSDNELTCAYSRATTLCVAHYKLETLAKLASDERASHSKLVALVQSEPSVRKARQDYERARLTRHLIGRHVRANEDIGSVRLGWSHDWEGWLVELQDDDDPAGTWVDYLALFYPWPVFVWYRASWMEVHRVEPVQQLEDEISLRPNRLWVCQTCNRPWPLAGLALMDAEQRCARCGDEEHFDDDFEETPKPSAKRTGRAHLARA